jgi:hypothetical protein
MGASVVDFFALRAYSGASGCAASASAVMPSRTVTTFAQFLQRILRIFPRTRSSPIEYRVLQRSQRNFTPRSVSPGSERHRRSECKLRGATQPSL